MITVIQILACVVLALIGLGVLFGVCCFIALLLHYYGEEER